MYMISLPEMLLSSSLLIILLILLRTIFRDHLPLKLQSTIWVLVPLRLLFPWNMNGYFSLMNLPLPWFKPDHPLWNSGSDSGQILFRIWLGGMILCGLFMLAANLYFYAGIVKKAHKTLCPDYPLPVFLSSKLKSPCLWGLWQCRVLLPPAALKTPSLTTQILVQQLCRHRRKDLWAVFLLNLCLLLYWFNPLVWLAAYLFRRDSLLVNDEMALAHLSNPKLRGKGQKQGLSFSQQVMGDYIQTMRLFAYRDWGALPLLQGSNTLASSWEFLQIRINLLGNIPTHITPLARTLVLAAGFIIITLSFSGRPI